VTRVTVTTRALAIVTEEWDLLLPAGTDPADIEDWVGLLDASAAGSHEPGEAVAVIVAVRDVEVTDETDRTFVRCEPTRPGGWHVFDPIEMRAWGPFPDEPTAEAFQRQDKYLQGSALVIDGPPPVPPERIWPPSAY